MAAEANRLAITSYSDQPPAVYGSHRDAADSRGSNRRRRRLRRLLAQHRMERATILDNQLRATNTLLTPNKPNVLSGPRRGSQTPDPRKWAGANKERHWERLVVPSGASQRLHTLHVLTPLQLRMWVGGESYETARLHGAMQFTRPRGPYEQQLLCTLHPNGEAPSSPRSVILRLTLTTSVEGTCSLTLVAPHWLINLSSLRATRLQLSRDDLSHTRGGTKQRQANAVCS